MENTKGVYFRTNRDDIDTLISIIQSLNDVISYEIVEVLKDTFSHEFTFLCRLSRKVYKGEKLIYVQFDDEDRKINKSYRLQDTCRAKNIKIDFFAKEDLELPIKEDFIMKAIKNARTGKIHIMNVDNKYTLCNININDSKLDLINIGDTDIEEINCKKCLAKKYKREILSIKREIVK